MAATFIARDRLMVIAVWRMTPGDDGEMLLRAR